MLEHASIDSRIVHLCWEFPSRIEGGLGQACGGMVAALRERVPLRVLVAADDGECFEVGESGVPSRGSQGSQSYQSAYADLTGAPVSYAMEQLYVLFEQDLLQTCDPFLRKVLRFNHTVLEQDMSGIGIVHAHDWLSLLAGVGLKRKYGCKLVWHVHSLQSDRVGYHDTGMIYQMERWGAAMADQIIAVSDYTKNILVASYGADAGKVRVVHNGIDAVKGVITPRGKWAKVLFLGRMTGQKSPEFMVEVARELLRNNGHVNVILAGEGERLPVLRDVVKFRNLQDRVHLVGRVDPGRVRGLLENVDVLCLPSLSEPFGLVALEAAMAGVEVIMSERCGAAEVLSAATVVHGFDRYVWAQEIERVLNDEGATERRERVQKEAASRTWHDAADEILEIYSGLRS